MTHPNGVRKYWAIANTEASRTMAVALPEGKVLLTTVLTRLKTCDVVTPSTAPSRAPLLAAAFRVLLTMKTCPNSISPARKMANTGSVNATSTVTAPRRPASGPLRIPVFVMKTVPRSVGESEQQEGQIPSDHSDCSSLFRGMTKKKNRKSPPETATFCLCDQIAAVGPVGIASRQTTCRGGRVTGFVDLGRSVVRNELR